MKFKLLNIIISKYKSKLIVYSASLHNEFFFVFFL